MCGENNNSIGEQQKKEQQEKMLREKELLVGAAELREKQRRFFAEGSTRDLAFRREMLKKLREGIRRHEKAFLEALARDLHKSEFEAYSNEIGLIYAEIKQALRHLRKWARPSRVIPEFHLQPGMGKVIPEPYGSVLIIAPWNYPMQLLFLPLVGAIAAGNTVVLKPSEIAPHSAEVTRKMIEESFDPSYIAVAEGGPELSQDLIARDFDYLFFTGSVPVGKKIMKAAAEHLTPLTLELGGKSPVFVDASADIETAARKIAFGKFNNAGQTCVAPDYALVDRRVVDEFLEAIARMIEEFYGSDPRSSSQYARIINEGHFERITAYLEEGHGDSEKGKAVAGEMSGTRSAGTRIYHGGGRSREELYIEPTILYPVDTGESVMKDEIFGPLLPVLTYETLDEAIEEASRRPKPLAAYVFSRDTDFIRNITERFRFGGGAVNETLLHVASSRLPFGGVGSSGIGLYHGKASFETFSHRKSLLKRPSSFDPKINYPHKNIGMRLLRRVLS